MPSNKRSVEDEDEESAEEKPTKKQRDVAPKADQKEPKDKAERKEVEGLGEVFENAEGDSYIKSGEKCSRQLGEYKRLTVRQWKGMTLIDIREFYKDKKDGQIKPGSKGVSLTIEQWNLVKGQSDAVDDLVAKLAKK